MAGGGLAEDATADVPIEVAALVAAIHTLAQTPAVNGNGAGSTRANPWRQAGRSELLR